MVILRTVKTSTSLLSFLLFFTHTSAAVANTWSEQLAAWIEPHGLRLESQDFDLLKKIVRKNEYNGDQALMVGVLAHVIDMSPQHFDQLYKANPELENLSELKSLSPIRTEMRAKTEERVLRALKKTLKENPEIPGTTWKTYKKFRVFKSVVSRFDEDTKEGFSSSIADSMANFAFTTPEYKNIFLSRLYYFARYVTDELFNLDPIAYTDFTFARGKTVLTPMIFANHPIDGDLTVNDFGFYTKSLPKVYVGETREKTTEWSYQGETFTADWSVRKTTDNVSRFIPKDKAPPYQSLWADHSLTGLVIAGVNLGIDGSYTLNDYKNYFKEQGFVFSKAEKIKNSKDYFKNLVESGEVDYFIKEAHSDGDEKIFFRISKAAKVVMGTKLHRNGTRGGETEKIILMYSDKDADTTDRKSFLITNPMFGEWMRAREAANGREFILFNTGCWSASGQAVTALEAARSQLLIVYAAKTAMNTFTNDATQAPYQFLHSFRKGLTFDEIRQNMMREKEYREGTADVLLFTDDPEYESEITSRLRASIAVDVQVYDSKGRLHSMDQVH